MGPDRSQRLAGGMAPAKPCELGKGARARSVNHHLQVMDRGIRRAIGRQPQRVVGAMPSRIPSFDGEIDPADERQAVVNANDLLVMGRIDRMLLIEAEVNARVLLPLGASDERQSLARRVQGGDAPYQDANLELGMDLDERAQQIAQRRRILAGIGP